MIFRIDPRGLSADKALKVPASGCDRRGLISDAKRSRRFWSLVRVLSLVDSMRNYSLWSNQSLQPTRMLPTSFSETFQRTLLAGRVADL